MWSPFLDFDLVKIAARVAIVASQFHLALWLRRALTAWRDPWSTLCSGAFLLAGLCLAGSVDVLGWDRVLLPNGAPLYWRLMGAIWLVGSLGAYLMLLALRGWRRWRARRIPARAARQTETSPHALTRRGFAATAAGTALAAPFAAAGYGTFIGRTKFELREVDLSLRDLPPALEGLRIAQLTDIHCGAFLTLQEVEMVVGMVNETRPHLAVVTGDLVTFRDDPLRACLQRLSTVKAEAGIFHCLGNHELYARSENFVEQHGRSLGMKVLRKESSLLRFGDARLNLCGVDYQRKHRPYLTGAEAMLDPSAYNVLLSHNPDVFPVAAAMGYDLVIGGHTHGGQVTVEIVEQWVNASRFFTPFVAGIYRDANAALYVSRGIGTINLPMRVGALPEVTLLRLRRA